MQNDHPDSSKGDACSEPVSEMVLLRDQSDKIRSLSGFQKSHRIPEQSDDRSQAFVASIATNDIANNLDQVHRALRKEFGFKRRELVVSEIIEGSASIETPDFRYDISVSVDEEDPSFVRWHYEVSRIRESSTIFSEDFESVFGGMFNIVEFSSTEEIVVEDLIDGVEELDDSRIDLEYPRDASFCTLKLSGEEVTVHFSDRGMRLVHNHPRTPAELLRVYFDLQTSLSDSFQLPKLN